MRPFATITEPGGGALRLFHGDFVGRLETAALRLCDPRISEAHAMVSLRGAELKLLALRGSFAVGGRRRSAVALKPRMRIELAENLWIGVEGISLPAEVLGIEGRTIPRQALTGVCSLLAAPSPHLVAGARADAAAIFWPMDARWYRSRPGDPPVPIEAGQSLPVAGDTLRFVAFPLTEAGQAPTAAGGLGGAVRVVAQYDTVHVHPAHGAPVVFSGLAARLISELVALRGPAPWAVVAALVWRDGADANLLRRRLDTLLNRIRARLRDGGVRPDLVRSDGAGCLEILAGSADVVEDRT